MEVAQASAPARSETELFDLKPVRCFTCGAVLRWKLLKWHQAKGTSMYDCFLAMRINKLCCRRMYLSS